MDTGGGPLTIKRLISDFPEYNHHVAGNPGVFMEHFRIKVGVSKTMFLKGPNIILNVYLILKFCLNNGIEVLHLHGRGAASFGRFVRLFKRNLKVVYTPNGFFPDSLPFGIKHIYILAERILFELTDLVFFVSKSEESTFASYYRRIDKRKFIQINNYLNPNQESYATTIPYTLPNDRINLLFIGRLSPQKGIDILIEALKKLMNNQICVYVVGYGEMEDYLAQQLRLNELNGKVVFLGKINEAFRLMPNFDALLLPSRFEGLPFTILEAMWYKLPLIVTPANGIVDVLNKENSYIASEISAESLRQVMEDFISDWNHNRKKTQDMVEFNSHLLASEYSLEAVRSKVHLLYD
jgi:glycosyltransferase involved in cell wall biosynthesis